MIKCIDLTRLRNIFLKKFKAIFSFSEINDLITWGIRHLWTKLYPASVKDLSTVLKKFETAIFTGKQIL